MTWTKKTPAVPGWYWMRGPRATGKRYICVVQIRRKDDGKLHRLGWPLDALPGREWSGPIPEPKD